MIRYEHPLNERIRTLMRLEDLYRRAQFFAAQADAAWFLHGGTPGRFPLTEIISLPFMVGSAEIGMKVLNDHDLRAKYLDAEHKGVKVLMLFTHQPGSVHTTKKPIRKKSESRKSSGASGARFSN